MQSFGKVTPSLPDYVLNSPDAARVGAVLVIDLAALVANWRDMAARTPGAECAAVVKANGYGLGDVAVATSLWKAGARTFFVADIEAGVRVRTALPDARVIVLHLLETHPDIGLNILNQMPQMNAAIGIR